MGISYIQHTHPKPLYMDQQNQNLFELQLDQPSAAYLGEAAKWAKFLAIIGFIFCGLMILAALFAGSIMGAMMSSMGGGSASMFGSGFITVVYLCFTAIYVFPCRYLFMFASQMQDALRSNEQNKLQTSFTNLKACFRFMGILFIVIMCFYVLAIIIVMIAGIGGLMT
jgi:preprotein translocase subunit SecG